MSARAFAASKFEPAAERTGDNDDQAPDGLATESQFRANLWHEYRLEAINAGFSAAQATEYANALGPEVGLVSSVSTITPAGRGWYYQSRSRVVNRTITSGLIKLARWKERRITGVTAAAGAPIFEFGFRPWNAREKA